MAAARASQLGMQKSSRRDLYCVKSRREKERKSEVRKGEVDVNLYNTFEGCRHGCAF